MAKEKHTQRRTAKAGAEPISWPEAVALFWPVAVLGAAIDLWTKSAVFAWLGSREQPTYTIIDGFLQFILRENTGAAFSAFQDWTKFLITISGIALLIILGIFFSRRVTNRLVLFSLGCITAGIVGNLYDRLFNEGRVRDFIDVYIGAWNWHWPTFNVADSLLCIGVGLLIITSMKSEPG